MKPWTKGIIIAAILSLSLSAAPATFAASPDFTISPNPTNICCPSLPPGASATITLTLTSLNGFAGAISLSSGFSSLIVPLNQASVTLTAGETDSSTVATVNCGDLFHPFYGTFVAIFTGESAGGANGILHTEAVDIHCNDFSISASPSSLTIPVGSSSLSTITLTGLGFEHQDVSLATSGPGLVASLNQAVVGFGVPGTGGTDSSTVLTIKCLSPGPFTVTVTGVANVDFPRTTSVQVTCTGVVPEFSPAYPAILLITAFSMLLVAALRRVYFPTSP